ncbi:hypothetical protein [Streptomyces sp. NBC_01717]|uniref:hypothetical protein n=1 Tax=Streptomyces sp. NBC_01717 TaxID=2975918 RepID=UPI002E33C50C|nr:hypothetical protein [Streptomyces sp. NBC_01717]
MRPAGGTDLADAGGEGPDREVLLGPVLVLAETASVAAAVRVEAGLGAELDGQVVEQAALGVPVPVDYGGEAVGLSCTGGGELGTGETTTHHVVDTVVAVAVAEREFLTRGTNRAAVADPDRLGTAGLPGDLGLAVGTEP